MKKLSKFTRLPFIPEINKSSFTINLLLIICILTFFYVILFGEKNPIVIFTLIIQQVILIYAPRKMIAKDLFFRNVIEFKGEIKEIIKSNREHYSTEIKISSSANIYQNLDQNFLLLTPAEHQNLMVIQLFKPFKKLPTSFDTDHFLHQDIIFRSFQHSAFIFDLGVILKDQLDHEVTFFFYHLEYFNQQGEKQTLKYKRIEQVKHHIHFKDRSHIVKLIFYKTEFTFICDKTQFMRLRELLYSSNISFL